MAQLNNNNQVKSISDMQKDEISNILCNIYGLPHGTQYHKKANDQQEQNQNENENVNAVADQELANKYNVQFNDVTFSKKNQHLNGICFQL